PSPPLERVTASPPAQPAKGMPAPMSAANSPYAPNMGGTPSPHMEALARPAVPARPEPLPPAVAPPPVKVAEAPAPAVRTPYATTVGGTAAARTEAPASPVVPTRHEVPAPAAAPPPVKVAEAPKPRPAFPIPAEPYETTGKIIIIERDPRSAPVAVAAAA